MNQTEYRKNKIYSYYSLKFYYFILLFSVNFVTQEARRITNTPLFRECPTIIDSNKKCQKESKTD